MKLTLGIKLFLVIGLFLTACEQADPINPPNPIVTPSPEITIPAVESPDVSTRINTLQTEAPIVTTALGPNLLSNAGFEQGTSAWSSCGDATTLNPINNSVTGSALALSSGCFYQTVAIEANQELSASCQANVLNSTGWSGMGLGISNANFVALAQSPERVLSRNTYRQYSTSIKSPAGSKYATLWIYSDGTTAVDDCVLKVGEADTPQGNLLSNPSFDTQTAWQNCGEADNYRIANGRLRTSGTACVYQTVNARANLNYELSCLGQRNTSVYSELSLAMLKAGYQQITKDSKVIPSPRYTDIKLVKLSPAGTAIIAVVIYSEGVSNFQSCDLRVAGTRDPDPEPDPNAPIEEQLAVGNILINPSFKEESTGWTNCGPADTFAVDNEKLTVNPGTCLYQEMLAEAGKTYHLTCQAKTDLPIYSVVTLNMLDANFQSLGTKARTINTLNRQWRTSLKAPATAKYVTVGFYTEGRVVYDYCYLTTATPPALIPETILPPVKPLSLLLPIYIDPGTTQVPWNKVISTASQIPTTVVINPNVKIEDCKTPSFKAMLARLEAANIETVGYVATGYTRRGKAAVKADIAKFKDCDGLDGIFFDEVINTTASQAYYDDICTYSRTLFNGKLVLNPGTNTMIPFTNEYCDVNLFIEESVGMWEEFAPYGFYGGATDPGLAGIVHTVPNNATAMKKVVDTAFSRKLDYIYVTDKTVPNPWTELPTFWNGLVNYIATKNATLQP